MHLTIYLVVFCINWAFSITIAATLPLADNRTQSSSVPEAPLLARLPESGCSPNSVSCPTVKRDVLLRTTRCEVPGTSTVLLIETGTRSVTPFRVKQLLLDARRIIARKLLEMGGVDRHLFIWEVPFKSAAWGLEMVVDPAPGPSSRDVLLTWRMLDETTAGLLVCVYDQGPFFELQAIIATGNARGTLESMGTLHLRRVFPASANSFQGKRDIRTTRSYLLE